jgi:hypothetical protein
MKDLKIVAYVKKGTAYLLVVALESLSLNQDVKEKIAKSAGVEPADVGDTAPGGPIEVVGVQEWERASPVAAETRSSPRVARSVEKFYAAAHTGAPGADGTKGAKTVWPNLPPK